MRALLMLAAAAVLAAPLPGQRPAAAPPRPGLAAGADTNDARAYYRLGREMLLAGRAGDAAGAFYWAAQIEPAWADPLYARHVALLMADRGTLLPYLEGDPRTRAEPAVLAIDSLYFRALRIDPFVQRPYEGELVQAWLRAALRRYSRMNEADAAAAAQWMLRDAPPLLRARVLAGEGRLAEALQAYDEVLRQRGGRRAETRRYVRYERARMYALAGNDSAALADLRQALDAGAEEEGGDRLLPLYDSKAVLQHSFGILLERVGDRAGARQAYAAAAMEDLAYYPAHVRLALLAVADGDTAAALGEMQLAAEAAAGEPPVLYTYGAMLAQLGRPDEAARHLARAAELAPFYADPWFALGVVYDGQGRLREARGAYQAFLHRAARGHRHHPAARKRLRDLAAAPDEGSDAAPPADAAALPGSTAPADAAAPAPGEPPAAPAPPGAPPSSRS